MRDSVQHWHTALFGASASVTITVTPTGLDSLAAEPLVDHCHWSAQPGPLAPGPGPVAFKVTVAAALASPGANVA